MSKNQSSEYLLWYAYTHPLSKKELGEPHKGSPMVRVTGFEPAASWSQTTRATNCATPGYEIELYYYSIPL